MHTYFIEDFGGKRFDYKLYELCCNSEIYKSLKAAIPESLLKATILRECEKAKIFGFNTPFELQFNKDYSFMLYKYKKKD